MIVELSTEHPIRELCALLGVARSGYYCWRQGAKSQRATVNGQLLERIKKIHEAKRGIYGSPRMTQELRRTGQRCNHKRVERLMRQQGLKGCTGRKRKPKTT